MLFPLLSQQGWAQAIASTDTVLLRLWCPVVSSPPPPPHPERNRPAKPSTASSSPRTRRPAPGKLGEGDAVRRKLWDLAGNNSYGRRCRLLCSVFFYFPGYGSRVSALGEEGKCLPRGFLLFPPHPRFRWRAMLGGGGGAGSPTPAWPPFCICLFHFCLCQLGSPILPRQSLSAVNGGTRVRRFQHGPHK